jgi:hypothetical protein
MLWAAYDLCGFRPLKAEKLHPWETTSIFVGVETDFTEMVVDSVIKLRIKPSTRAKVRDIVQSALGSNSLTPTEAGSLYGKLRWVFSLGRIGLGALSVIEARQYAGTPAGSGGSWALDEGLRMAFVVILDSMAEDGEEFPSVIHSRSSRGASSWFGLTRLGTPPREGHSARASLGTS